MTVECTNPVVYLDFVHTSTQLNVPLLWYILTSCTHGRKGTRVTHTRTHIQTHKCTSTTHMHKQIHTLHINYCRIRISFCFSSNVYAIITACIFDLQVLGDLMMCILFYDDQQEHELGYKEKIHLNTLVCTEWVIVYFDVHF